MDSSGDWLFVTNSNADLRYNDGTLLALSLARGAMRSHEPYASGAIRSADPPRPETIADCGECPRSTTRTRVGPHHFCCWNALDRSALNCDERYYVGSDAAAMADEDDRGNGNVRIGSFAAAMLLQHRQCPTTTTPPARSCAGRIERRSTADDRLLIGVRGDTSMTFIDVVPTTPGSGTPPALELLEHGGRLPDVRRHAPHQQDRVGARGAAARTRMPPDVTLPDEPYALALDDANGLLYVGHLSGQHGPPVLGRLLAVRRDADSVRTPLQPPRLIAPFPSPFTPSSIGAVGVSALKSYKPSNSVTNIYASSRFVPQVAPLGVTAVCPRNGSTVREIAAFPNGDVLQLAADRRRDPRNRVRGHSRASCSSERRPR